MGPPSSSGSSVTAARAGTAGKVESSPESSGVCVPDRRGRSDARRNRNRLWRVIFIDSNIPMYLVGAAHPNKTSAQILLESLIAKGERLVTDAEVLQEILHRY